MIWRQGAPRVKWLDLGRTSCKKHVGCYPDAHLRVRPIPEAQHLNWLTDQGYIAERVTKHSCGGQTLNLLGWALTQQQAKSVAEQWMREQS